MCIWQVEKQQIKQNVSTCFTAVLLADRHSSSFAWNWFSSQEVIKFTIVLADLILTIYVAEKLVIEAVK